MREKQSRLNKTTEQLGKKLDRCDRCPQLVAHGGEELIFRPYQLSHPLLRRLALGDIPQGDHAFPAKIDIHKGCVSVLIGFSVGGIEFASLNGP